MTRGELCQREKHSEDYRLPPRAKLLAKLDNKDIIICKSFFKLHKNLPKIIQSIYFCLFTSFLQPYVFDQVPQ